MYQNFKLLEIKLPKNALAKSLLVLLFASSCAVNLYAECTGSTSIYCNSTVDSAVYNNATLDIPAADLLDVNTNTLNGISNIGNGTWSFNDVNVAVSADNIYGAFADLNAIININGNLSVLASGYGAGAIFANAGSNVIANNNVVINISGYGATGISAKDGSVVNINGHTTINSLGNYANAIYLDDSTINLNGGVDITTAGNYSNAIFAKNGTNANIGANSQITTNGYGSYAISAVDSSIVTGDNLYIQTNGGNAHAVYANDRSNILIGNNSQIITNGYQSYGVMALNSSTIIFNGDTYINTGGYNSLAIAAAENANISTNGAVKLNLQGSIISDNNALINLTMSDGSTLIGDTLAQNGGKINLSFDGVNSFWKIGGNSSLSNLYLTNGAKTAFDDIAAVLNIENLYGNGLLELKVAVDNGNLTGNKIKINSSSSGNFQVLVNDSQTGSVTNVDQALLLIEQSSGALSNYQANFSLNNGSVDIGQFVYTLNSNSSNKNFYLATNGTLNNAALSSVSFLHVNYLTNYLSIQTLLQRMGEIRNNPEAQNDMWIKVNAGKLSSFEKTFNINNVDYYSITGGIDSIYDMDGSSILLGMFADFLKADVSFGKGNGNGDSKAIGIYTTYKHDNGFYADLVGKYTSNNNKFSTVTSGGYEVSGDGDTRGFSVTLEGGKKITFGNFYVEPQVAATYARQNDLSITSSNQLKTNIDGFDSIIGRASMIAGLKLRDTNVYIKGGYVKEFEGEVSYSFNDAPQKYQYDIKGNFWDSSIGIIMNVKNRQLYLEGAYQKGDEFNNQKINLGYRFSF
ncbi:MAG: autotransporter outer membrane beta-barrel domain-containing protein [Campylobacteraceae bacterium]|jgi:outer membrane autotransporter protein|nr:autotransporter outer membrane beta-barrel domain-containing protein [Campylobacteraceae bacterium]